MSIGKAPTSWADRRMLSATRNGYYGGKTMIQSNPHAWAIHRDRILGNKEVAQTLSDAVKNTVEGAVKNIVNDVNKTDNVKVTVVAKSGKSEIRDRIDELKKSLSGASADVILFEDLAGLDDSHAKMCAGELKAIHRLLEDAKEPKTTRVFSKVKAAVAGLSFVCFSIAALMLF